MYELATKGAPLSNPFFAETDLLAREAGRRLIESYQVRGAD